MKDLTPKKLRKLYWLLLGPGLLLGFIGVGVDSMALVVIGIVIMLLALLFHVLFYRCPHCNRFLDRNTGEYCPHCGEKVNE